MTGHRGFYNNLGLMEYKWKKCGAIRQKKLYFTSQLQQTLWPWTTLIAGVFNGAKNHIYNVKPADVVKAPVTVIFFWSGIHWQRYQSLQDKACCFITLISNMKVYVHVTLHVLVAVWVAGLHVNTNRHSHDTSKDEWLPTHYDSDISRSLLTRHDKS